MTTDDAWERLKEAGCPLDLHPLQEQVTKAELGRILLQVHRETVEACAAVADRWLTVQGEIGPLQTLGIHNAAEGIGREILALIPKGDGRCQ